MYGVADAGNIRSGRSKGNVWVEDGGNKKMGEGKKNKKRQHTAVKTVPSAKHILTSAPGNALTLTKERSRPSGTGCRLGNLHSGGSGGGLSAMLPRYRFPPAQVLS